ncbi:cell division control protein Cdc6 [candidate division MSBL1 archaeon SCGC-AAA261G05]|uniref:ORC1-type DNA replication protein n=3 Tax=candidate division MSBL1 TaxID=215777 RepID=A0A133V105_9EURY|nr:cell division control protein Cdc6 [candidate division MSBL1 archaeon SCGC-AAA261C02]KXB04136.1 cell division control protein Cdc6 [candidate division MSBL1 archaeon SCGC-AAA261G05]KXB05026.1 cell division control protein Cdc6 [candidate division MSBL1 archaeon SCGC-AAA261O19]
MKKESGGLFEKLLETQQIFKNREYLRPTYIPDNLPHREEQIDQLARIWVAPLRGETPSNVFVYGKAGTGKTATVKYLMNELEKTGDEVSRKIEVIHLNCEVVNTKYRILATLANELRGKIQEKDPDAEDLPDQVPMTGWPTDQVYSVLLEILELEEQIVIILLDEIDKLISKGADDVLYVLTRINSDLANTKTAVVGISNDLNFVPQLDPRVVSSLGEEEVLFPPYNAPQIEDILKKRAEMSFEEGVLDDAVIRLCAAHAARGHGDARQALDLLRNAGELAEQERATKVTTKHVTKAFHKVERDKMEEAIRTLPEQSKLVLLSALLLQERKARKIGTGDVYDVYSALCRQNGLEVLTRRRVSGLISELDMMGVLNARVISKGRYGRTKEIELNVESIQARAAIEDEMYVKDLNSITSSKQEKLG